VEPGSWLGLALGAGLLAAVWLLSRERRRRVRAEIEARRLRGQVQAGAGERERLELRYALLADSSRDLLLIADAELTLSYANAAAEEFFGPVRPGVSLIGYTHSSELEEQARQAVAAGEPELERVLSVRDRPFRSRVRRRGDVVGLSLTDAAELQRLTRARQDLVANLSHELRTPLTSLELLAETLVARGPQDPVLAGELTRKILAEVGTLQQMTQEMLDLSAIESGRLAARLTPVALREIVRRALQVLREQAARRGVELRESIDPDLRVLADADQAARAVQNVLHNALKFSPDGGQVLLSARAEPDGAGVVLSIVDQGPGILPSDLGRIFERFYRGDAARGTAGTGLGLAITRHILQAHGGSAWAENRPPPQSGAAVFLRFLPA
jgi:two-component system phosphate regulon sensor histidine kinase PhoR